jgi:hypothetical protein
MYNGNIPFVCSKYLTNEIVDQLTTMYTNYKNADQYVTDELLVLQPDINELSHMITDNFNIIPLLRFIHDNYCTFPIGDTIELLCSHIGNPELTSTLSNIHHIDDTVSYMYNECIFTKFNMFDDSKDNNSILTDITPLHLSIVNMHDKDVKIKFTESTHTYFIDFYDNDIFTSSNVLSTTTVIHKYFEQFNEDDAISKMRNGRKWGPNNKYWGRTDDEIKRIWELNRINASSKGTFLHFTLERDCNGLSHMLTNYSHIIEMKQYRKWKSKHLDGLNLIPYRTEFRMFTDEYSKICGTSDLLAIDRNHKPPTQTSNTLSLVLIDWKFSKAIKYENTYQKGKGACSHMQDCNFNHYSLQQNLYKYMLEKHYKNWNFNGYVYEHVQIINMRLAVFHENHGEEGLNIIIDDLQDLIVGIVGDRTNEICKIVPADQC